MALSDTEREAILKRLDEFADQRHDAEDIADQGSLDRAADIVKLYEDKSWVAEVPAPKRRVNRGRPVDPESFSRFSKWLATKTKVASQTAYQLRDAHSIRTTYFRAAEVKPAGEYALRPLKWMHKHEYGERIPEVWNMAVKFAGGTAPDNPTVRKALTQWKADNGLTGKRSTGGGGKRGGPTLVERWIKEADQIMLEYPELFAPAMEEIMAHAARLMKEDEAA